jgi:hypothetical protein
MALYGAVAEGWSYSAAGGTPGPRYGDFQFRGQATFTGSTTITIPLPIRFAGFPMATLVSAVAPTGTSASVITVGTIVANTFKIYAWQTSVAGTWAAASTSCTVNWQAFGSVTDNFVTGAY